MAADAATFHNYGRLLHHTQHAVCTFKLMYYVLHAVPTTSILDSFDDCWYAKHCTISVFKTSRQTDL